MLPLSHFRSGLHRLVLGERVQFLVRGEAALGFFGIGQAAVDGDFEDAAAAGRQADFGA
jgi:hypothetical protein